MTHRLAIAPEVTAAFPRILVGALLVEGLRVLPAQPQLVAQIFDRARERLAAEGVTTETLAAHPIIEGWRKGFSSCGLKPSTYRSSPEQLVRRLLKGGVATPLPVVDLYCAISTAYLTPLGAYDIDRLPASTIDLRYGDPSRDRFSPLGARAEDMPISGRVVLYASGDEVLCWGFNHRDSRQTCLLPDSDRALFMGEGLGGQQNEALREALDELAKVLSTPEIRCFGPIFASVEVPVLDL